MDKRIYIMKFVKILNYVENSYEGSPSFVILMSDGKEYISNGCVFIEKTQKNITKLIILHECEKELDELFESPGIEINELVDAGGMFRGCESLTEFTHDMPNLVNGTLMFSRCETLTTFTSDLPNLVNGTSMFAYCTSLTKFSSELPKLKMGLWMFDGCTSLTILKIMNGCFQYYDL